MSLLPYINALVPTALLMSLQSINALSLVNIRGVPTYYVYLPRLKSRPSLKPSLFVRRKKELKDIIHHDDISFLQQLCLLADIRAHHLDPVSQVVLPNHLQLQFTEVAVHLNTD